ncbi:MAG: hypothetical protein PHU68_07975 [Paludibacter sp.]|nr:hypothetical protein [Paludibacter sp.]
MKNKLLHPLFLLFCFHLNAFSTVPQMVCYPEADNEALVIWVSTMAAAAIDESEKSVIFLDLPTQFFAYPILQSVEFFEKCSQEIPSYLFGGTKSTRALSAINYLRLTHEMVYNSMGIIAIKYPWMWVSREQVLKARYNWDRLFRYLESSSLPMNYRKKQ